MEIGNIRSEDVLEALGLERRDPCEEAMATILHHADAIGWIIENKKLKPEARIMLKGKRAGLIQALNTIGRITGRDGNGR